MLQLRLFGEPQIILGGESLTDLTSAKARGLLFYLAVTRQSHTRLSLAALLWGELPEASARGNLRKALQQLRKHLATYLIIERNSVALAPNTDYWVDVIEFETLLQGTLGTEAPDQLQHAIDLYHGDFLESFYLRNAPEFENWWLTQRASLREKMLDALHTLADYHAEEGDLDAAIPLERRYLDLEPWREGAHRRLMLLLTHSGQRGKALAQYENCRKIMADELAVEPSQETISLYEGIRDGIVKPQESEMPAPIQTGFHDPPQPSVPLNLGDRITIQEPALFVGRERELRQLWDTLERSLTGKGQVIFLTGEPGQGKTSLMTAFARKALEQYPHLLVLQGNCNAFSGQGDPYHPFREVLNQLTGDVSGRHSPFPLTHQQAFRLWETAPGAIQLLVNHGSYLIDTFVSNKALLDNVLAISPGETNWIKGVRDFIDQPRPRSDDLPQSALFEQFTNVLRSLSAERPILVLLDDLQWADQGSLHLLAHLAQRLIGTQIFLVGTYRSEEVALRQEGHPHPLLSVLNDIQCRFGDVMIDLHETDDQIGRDFINAFLDSEPNQLGNNFREQLFTRTRGHPLFTVELLQTMQNRGDLIQDPEMGWVVSRQLNWDHLPARIEAVISARVGRLDDPLRRILMAASIEGDVFTVQVIAQVEGLSDRSLFKYLTQELAGQHHLVRESGEVEISGRFLTRYQFTHSLFQEYFYTQLGVGERRLLHGEVATALESLYTDQIDRVLAELAHHFTEAGWGEKAVTYLQRAGNAAVASYANKEAIAYFSQALNIIPDENLKDRYDLLLAREDVYSLLGNRVQQSEDLDLLESLAVKMGEITPRAKIALRRANYALDINDQKNAIRAARLGIFLAQEIGDLGLIARGHLLWGRGLSSSGDFDQVIPIYEKALSLSQQAGVPEITAHANLNIGFFIIYYHRDFPTGKQYLDEALRFYQTRGDQIGEARVLEHLGKLYSKSQGDHAASLRYLDQSLIICSAVGDRYQENSIHNARGGVFLALGDYAGAKADYATSLRISREINSPGGVAYSVLNLGNISRELGSYANALQYHEQALNMFREIDEPIGIGYTLTDMGDVFTHMKEWKKAAKYLMEAIEIRELLNQPHMSMESRAGLARVVLAQGKSAKALQHVELILDYLGSGYTLEGAEQIFRVYLTCYQVLLANHESRAEELLESAYIQLLEQAEKITDHALQQSFLKNIPWHREIVQLWESRASDG